MSDHNDTELVVQQEGPVVQVTMNRPAALNALSLEMIRLFSACLTRCAADDSVKAVFIKGAGGRAFCAGGDIKSAYTTGMSYRHGNADERVISLFFGEEYHLNRQLFHYKKPLFAFMNGITMGGGFGIAGPCRYRIASENTVFAMPEVGIGFFPDVGSTYFLNRAPGQAGAFLTMTGASVGAVDTLFCGFAGHYVPCGQQEALEHRLREVIGDSPLNRIDSAIDEVLAGYGSLPEEPGVIETNGEMIDRCFADDKVLDVIANLRKEESTWARKQADIIESRSPVSLKVSLAHLRMTRPMSFDEVTAQDFILAQHFVRGHDFYEGVRAVLVDKDNMPVWEPKTLDEVSNLMVQDYFHPTGMNLDEIAA